jgi:hypothetical protein
VRVGYVLVNLRKRPGLHGNCNSWVGWRVGQEVGWAYGSISDCAVWTKTRLGNLQRKAGKEGCFRTAFEEVEYEESEVRR